MANNTNRHMSNIKKSVNFFHDLMALIVIFKIAPILMLSPVENWPYVCYLIARQKKPFYLFCKLINGSFSAKKLYSGKKLQMSNADADI